MKAGAVSKKSEWRATREAGGQRQAVPDAQGCDHAFPQLLHLQQAAGNRAVNLLLGEPLQRQPEEEEAPMPPETTSTAAAGPKTAEAPMPPKATPAPPVKGGGEQAPMPPETTSTAAAGPKTAEAPMPPEATPAPPVKGGAGGEQAPMPPETTSTAAAGPEEVTSPAGGLSADARKMALGMYESMVVSKVESAHDAAVAKDAQGAYADVGVARDAAMAIARQIGPETEATATLAATYAVLQNSLTRLEPHVGIEKMPLEDVAKQMDPKSAPMESWLDGPRIALTKEGK